MTVSDAQYRRDDARLAVPTNEYEASKLREWIWEGDRNPMVSYKTPVWLNQEKNCNFHR